MDTVVLGNREGRFWAIIAVKGMQPFMRNAILLTGNRVRVTSYGPFRGLQGVIQRVDVISDDLEDPFCFYLIALEGSVFRTPVWFAWHEVECIGFPVGASQRQRRVAGVESAQL
jgi:hypothetical protein